MRNRDRGSLDSPDRKYVNPIGPHRRPVRTTFRFVNQRVPNALERCWGIVAVSSFEIPLARVSTLPPPTKPGIRGQRGDWPRILGARRAKKVGATRIELLGPKFRSTATGSDLSRNSMDRKRGRRVAPTSLAPFPSSNIPNFSQMLAGFLRELGYRPATIDPLV